MTAAAALGARKTRRSTESTERLCSLLSSLLCSAEILRVWCSSLQLVCHGMQYCLHTLKGQESNMRVCKEGHWYSRALDWARSGSPMHEE